jgi:spore coat protein U-like protein
VSRLSTLAIALLITFLLQSYPQPALAVTCSATSPGTQSFGNVNPVSGQAYSTSGTLSVTCTVGALEGLVSGTVVRACLNFGLGNGSSPRALTSGATSVQYNLYSDAAHTQIAGSSTGSPQTPIVVDFNLTLLGILLGGTASVNVPIYGFLPAGQTTVPAATYTQSFSGANAALYYTIFVGAAPSCSTSWTNGGSFAFGVTANVTNNCNVNATNVNFGSSGLLTSPLTATGVITAQCTANDSYSIALNAGTTTGASLGNRQMVLSGQSSTINYQLYTSAGRTTIWGDGTSGTATLGAVATGSNQTYTVYGLVPAQSTPMPGAYTDTVTATVTY